MTRVLNVVPSQVMAEPILGYGARINLLGIKR